MFSKKLNSLDGFGEVTFVADEHEEKGPLAGIEAGLKALEAVCRFAFVVGCDVPVLVPRLAEELLRIARQHDCRAVTPVEGERVFGMTAVYRTDTWSKANELISKNSLRVSELAERLSARKVELAELRAFDPELVSFLNINNPQAYSAFITSQGGAVDTDLMDRLNGGVRKHL
jgi:molybdopterin-guanine dinucleotide biosynthesis protein A